MTSQEIKTENKIFLGGESVMLTEDADIKSRKLADDAKTEIGKEIIGLVAFTITTFTALRLYTQGHEILPTAAIFLIGPIIKLILDRLNK
ncbi:hypothetical protein [[Eubacterium] cellulosolvens]